jgi:hypothetical protein
MKNKTIAEFLYSGCCNNESVTIEKILFDANLQEFAQRVRLITALENGGKILPHEAFIKLQAEWQKFLKSSSQIGLEESLPE